MRTPVAAVVATLFAACALLSAQSVAVVVPGGTFPSLETYLEALRQQAGIPGMSAAVVQDGEVVWERGFGFQNVAARVRATPDTPYEVGDMSQMFAAVLLLQCVEQRLVDLDAPIRNYGVALPELTATTRQVLNHTSADTPGEAFTYSPERYGQLTTSVEKCVPQPYRKSVAHRILDRLAMRDSVPGTDIQTFEADVESGLFDESDLDRYRRTLEKVALPYKVDSRNRAERTDAPPAALSAATGLVSTVRDLARFDAQIDSTLLLREETLATAWRPPVTRTGAALPAGLGWFVQTYRAERIVWHFGLIPNEYSSLIVKVPARRLTFLLLANSDRLSSPFQLEKGDVSRSLFASLFLRLVT
jgi:CubicO group peptidase (beta-lactamase class C family)